jgi:hypothetical protein
MPVVATTAVQTVLVPKGKQPLQKCLGKSINSSIRRVPTNHNRSCAANLFGQLRKIILYLADIVLFTPEAGDTWAYIDFAKLYKFG